VINSHVYFLFPAQSKIHLSTCILLERIRFA
jgi:hypothetical protein